jgi:hypothetical protein
MRILSCAVVEAVLRKPTLLLGFEFNSCQSLSTTAISPRNGINNPPYIRLSAALAESAFVSHTQQICADVLSVLELC